MKLVWNKIVVLAVFSVLISCKEKTKNAENTEITTEVESTEKTEASAPNPVKVYTNEGISVNAYEYDGLQYFLNRDNNTTYVVNFWATWCVPCVEELPHFEKLNAEYKNDDVKVLLVSLDMRKMIESKLIPFLKDKQLKSEVVVMTDPDSNSWIPKVDSTWSGALPATIIYNKDKRKFYEQSFTYEELERELLSIK